MYVQLTADKLRVEYRITLPPSQAWIEMARMDEDQDGTVSAEEKQAFFTKRGKQIAERFDGKTAAGPIVLKLANSAIDSAMAQTYVFEASATDAVTLRDNNFAGQPGSLRLLHDDGTRVELVEQVDLGHAETVTLRIQKR